METTVGSKLFTNVGNITPTGTAVRIWGVDTYSTVSGSGISLHNGVVSSTVATLYIMVNADSTGGTCHEYWDGVLFPDGVWLNTHAAGAINALVSYSIVKA